MKKLISSLVVSLSMLSAVHAKDIVDTAAAAGNFTTLATALKAAGLVETLKGPGPFTVFAPTDAAFAKIPADQLQALLMDNNSDDLVKFTGYSGEGFCVSSIYFNANFDAPTFMPSAAPTTLPLPVYPVLGSLVLTIHSGPLCASTIYQNDMAPYGECQVEGPDSGNGYGAWRMTIDGDYSAANPRAPLHWGVRRSPHGSHPAGCRAGDRTGKPPPFPCHCRR